ncbi:HPr family phosphocarrier protein [Motilimonas pumila]|uniref:HPr family phosphocarrier protein n=1 Tax=Motilimonas pumila TaxID=2303987 RepID=A0A418YI20_9GAMM|nr:HPr family phosphocarrier protein [Motilimonas pumila]RJG49995.1 HPr family phosphocarrier protein [Motilimonas pumila]
MPAIEQTITIKNKLGLHARAAVKLAELANKFNATVTLIHGEKQASAASVMGLLMLETCQGQSITLEADGEDAQLAMDAVKQLIEDKFEEAE